MQKRKTIHDLPAMPTRCAESECEYNRAGFCNSPQFNTQRHDAVCHPWSIENLLTRFAAFEYNRNSVGWVHCIAHTHHNKKGESWCGRSGLEFEFHFVSIDHAVYNEYAEGRLGVCPACWAAILATVRTVIDD